MPDLMDLNCITSAEFSGLMAQTFLVPPDAVRAYHVRPFCPDVKISQSCDITQTQLQKLVDCKKSIDAGNSVLPSCMLQMHPVILNAVRSQCPAVAAQFDAMLNPAQPQPQPQPSPGPAPSPTPQPSQASAMSRNTVIGIGVAAVFVVGALAWAATRK